MQLTFEAVSEARPGPKWHALFNRYWPAYRAWLTRRSGSEAGTNGPVPPYAGAAANLRSAAGTGRG